MFAYVDRKRCIGCGACVEICPMHAVRLVDGTAQIDASLCTGCEACADVCPQRAITMVHAPAAVESRIVPAASLPTRSSPAAIVTRPERQVRPWVGAVLAFVAREVVPRLATSLLDAWDRRHASVATTSEPLTANPPVSQSMPAGMRPGGVPHQHRWQHGRR